jgi:hypothetical protein
MAKKLGDILARVEAFNEPKGGGVVIQKAASDQLLSNTERAVRASQIIGSWNH